MYNFDPNKEAGHTEKLLKEWKPILEHKDYAPIHDRYRRMQTAIILENTRNECLRESAPTNAIGTSSSTAGAGGIDTYDPVLIGLIRRAAPNMMAYDFMGVQAMKMPTGLVFSLRSTYKNQESAAGERDATEAFYREANSAWSGQSANATSGTVNAGSPWSANVVAGSAFEGNAAASDFNYGTGMDTYAAEALGDARTNDFNEMAFTIDKTTVTAKSRALKAEYTMELAQDLKAVHGLDAESELANILSTEILAEINREMIRRLYYGAKRGCINGQTATNYIFNLDVDSNGRWSVEKFKGLAFQIEREANAIAKDTRRGKGNILITSSDVASALQMTGVLEFNPQYAAALNIDDTGSTFAGTIGRMKVFIDPYYISNGSEFAVVGYKGTSPFDAGAWYCPYVPLQMVRAVGENSFQPKIGFKTRYGYVVNPFVNTTGSVVAGENYYYRRFSVTNLL